MQCVKCKNDETNVIDSRIADEGRSVRRRRECAVCGHRFTTYERPEFAAFTVVKATGKREPYSRTKLEKGIKVAVHKRPISSGQIESLISGLEEKWAANKKEISTKRMGRDVMESLKLLDEVAYLRFASVCQDFGSASEFLTEMEKIAGRRKESRKAQKEEGQPGLFEK